ncbi:GTPase-activating protein [Veronia nyctiphanis]|uniref:Der GTPase-activating protein YihI n=1 Tax=Veronia nyctiphanis TaxID=1278244 RepID=A0A4Q0YRC2_9GAMM|nr:Der GTPase-activating protein YihI [Veronia nyctiphanis]RXJ72644.1 GTPase-activating protein [Veronia nyctiphanis]
MTRKKRSRKAGSEGPAQYDDRTPSQSDNEGRLQKKLKKRKGLKAGSRHSDAKAAAARKAAAQKDPRHGSKKAIPLIVEQKPHPKSAQAKKARRLSAEQELEMLENDAQLNVLLDRIENGESLGAGLQSYVDEKLDRIEALMSQLGLLDDDELEDEKQPAKPSKRSDDDLLAAFENLDMDQE